MQLLLRSQVLLARGCNDEFGIVDEAGVVRIDRPEHFLHLLIGHDPSVMLQVPSLDFLHRKLAVSVGIKSLEDLGEIVAFALAHQLRRNERERRLLQRNVAVEFAQVVQSVHRQVLVHLKRRQLGDPGVLESLLGRGALLWVVGEQGTDKTLAVLGDCLPDAVIEVELSFADLLHDVLVRLSVERRHAREKNIRDNTC